MYLQILVLSFDSLENWNLDSASMFGIKFPLTYSISKSNAINLIAYLSILDVVTLGNSFLGLNINSNGLWSLLKRIFFPIKNCQSLMVVQTMAKASFSLFEWLNSVFVSLLDNYIIGCPLCDNIPDIECSLASVVNVMSFFGSKIFSACIHLHNQIEVVDFNLLYNIFFLLFNFSTFLFLFFTEKTSILVSFSSTLSRFFFLNLHTAWKWFFLRNLYQFSQILGIFPFLFHVHNTNI